MPYLTAKFDKGQSQPRPGQPRPATELSRKKLYVQMGEPSASASVCLMELVIPVRQVTLPSAMHSLRYNLFLYSPCAVPK